jgi:hypothetical protein
MTRISLAAAIISNDGKAEMREAERLYDLAEIKRLKALLPSIKSVRAGARFTREIRRWAAGYLAVANRWRIRGERTSLLAVADSVVASKVALQQLDLRAWIALIRHLPQKEASVPLPTIPQFTKEDRDTVLQEAIEQRLFRDDQLNRALKIIGSIEQAARSAAKEFPAPKAGRPKRVTGDGTVIALCEIYEAATGRKPTRRWKETSGSYGPFREFVIAALTPLEGAAKRGIDERIKRALRSRKRS